MSERQNYFYLLKIIFLLLLPVIIFKISILLRILNIEYDLSLMQH